MFAVTKMPLFVPAEEIFLLNSGNVISLVILVRFLVSAGMCKKNTKQVPLWGSWDLKRLLGLLTFTSVGCMFGVPVWTCSDLR